jgi:hypothetical protein
VLLAPLVAAGLYPNSNGDSRSDTPDVAVAATVRVGKAAADMHMCYNAAAAFQGFGSSCCLVFPPREVHICAAHCLSMCQTQMVNRY